MTFPASLAMILVGLIFFLSGFVVNFIQAIVYVLLRPVSKSLYGRVNNTVAELLWQQLVWLVDWWSNLKIQVHADDQTYHLMGKENALVMCNHKSDIDWLVGWVLAQRSDCLGSALAVMKKELKTLPIIGWSMWFSGYLFLERSWAKDEGTLESGYKWLEDFPLPFWLALFVEGTRFTNAKLEAAQIYAASKGLPIPRNVLIPRTKGFVSAVSNIRSFVPAIYDCTLAVPKDQLSPTILSLFRRQPCVVYVHIKRHSINELPETPDGIAQWCKDLFVTKDAILENFYLNNTFSSEKVQQIGKPRKSLMVFFGWSSLVAYGMARLVGWLAGRGSWEVLAFALTLIAIVFVIMQMLIHSSQAEQSPFRPPTAASPDGITVSLIQN